MIIRAVIAVLISIGLANLFSAAINKLYAAECEKILKEEANDR